MVTWSRKYYERDREKHRRKVELLESLSQPAEPGNPDSERLIPVSRTLRSYIKEGCSKDLKARTKDGRLKTMSADDVFHIIDKEKLERTWASWGTARS